MEYQLLTIYLLQKIWFICKCLIIIIIIFSLFHCTFLNCTFFFICLESFICKQLYCIIVGRVFANGLGDLGSIPGQVIPKTLKIVLDTTLVSRVKWNNLGKGVAPTWTPRCSNYWKGSLLVALDYSRQRTYLYCIKYSYKIKIT